LNTAKILNLYSVDYQITTMNKQTKNIAEQLLIVSNIFIVFLLLFENKWVVPLWLQSVGRMHPLLLHFPIVILLLALGMEFCRFKPAYVANEFYRTSLSNLLLIGGLLAAITVMMGLFLSKEAGYEGETLQWHKWSGVGIFFLVSIIYFVRNTTWYQVSFAKIATTFSAIVLVLTGHYGAILTHGENFITAPLIRPTPVPLEQAVVFDDVIRPIFEQKCVSCHNPDKIKGELMLTNKASILKGGKSGKLFVAGQPEISLLLQRIHLPLDDKKHMPPVGKVQLNPQEIRLLSLWIKDNADFEKKVIDLPPNDSLRVIAASLFTTAEKNEEKYDFDAANEETITKLSNEYRTIAPVAHQSPALAVSFFNKNAYNAQKLEELSELKTQIVSLSLAKMPVKDADLGYLSAFENLEKLDLNFTDITTNGLKELTPLQRLKSLSISGTRLNFRDLQAQLSAFKGLKTVYIWNTPLTPAEVQQLQKSYKNIRLVAGFRDDGSNPIKLNPPQIKNASTIFGSSILLQLSHPIKGVQIRYTTDGTEPDSLKSPLFTQQTLLKESTHIRAKAYKAGWFGSDEATFDFYKNSHVPDSLNLLLPLNRVHQAAGAKTFFDGKLGTFNANSPAWANNWAGVRNNDLVLMSEFKTPVMLSSVGLRIMEEVETGIFPPEFVEIWGGTNPKQMKLLAKLKPAIPTQLRPHLLYAVTGQFKPTSITHLKIIAKPLQKIPEWHGSKGRVALLLVDEMFLN
jgi:uncharacterized membrane protein